MSSTQAVASFSFEKAIESLQLSVRKLESGELSLEDSLKCFEEGVRLTRQCQDYLSAAERKVELLVRPSTDGNNNGSPEFNPFKS